jgi:hypothetical protein
MTDQIISRILNERVYLTNILDKAKARLVDLANSVIQHLSEK